MNDLSLDWKKTKKEFNDHEQALVACYIAFLRKTAKHYLLQGRRVYFKENNIVHWGEWNFGKLVIEGREDIYDVFGEYIAEIAFEPEISDEVQNNCAQVTLNNLGDIRYEIR
jgi:hypothetical protein